MTTKSVSLQFREGGSDKVYNVQIAKHTTAPGYMVTFQYGRTGSALQSGTKTALPVTLAQAEAIFTKLVNEKKAKGYNETGVTTAAPVGESSKEVDPDMLPQLLTEISEDEAEKYITDDAYCAQEKLDGRNKTLRNVGGVVTSANKKGQTVPTPDAVAQTIRQCDWCQLSAEHIGDIYHVHNITQYEGQDVRHLPYVKRLEIVFNILAHLSNKAAVQPVDTAMTTAEKRAMFKRLKKENREGIVFKLKSAPFTAGYCETQKKCKFWSSLSARIRTIRPGGRESIECELLDDAGKWVSCGNVTVLKRGLIDTLAVGDVCEIKYLYAVRGSGILYQPSPCMTGDTFKRDDVDAEECRTSQIKYRPEPKE